MLLDSTQVTVDHEFPKLYGRETFLHSDATERVPIYPGLGSLAKRREEQES